ncbi:diguanylate cyclase (GGDEF) domain-containing protein [Saccharopolyspora antimicrobica]|uniref:Diguanylate cyclase (GGDEF) domain-containing protein n=1 Tax=Saccharopolyspora antimicrobica TaxID=455193 RepID=A0A1I4XC23_9PSEU|nr:GGDEF domain-containing protein [Saccharopolyspora antimicrobica]RKT84434.1 diguanylate cyclase (GGDEF)-like protein [Saccharopolyspora antimicrobica]SFN23325.1 diguanylate cyclase (GGDEF) domain-containing protein [Saccharopolyspora antimicrobica]
MGGWLLWRLRPAAIAYVLLVQAVALALLGLVVATSRDPAPRELLTFVMLAATAGTVIVVTSVSINVKRQIRRNPWTLHIAYLATGILVLPPNLLVLLLLGPTLHGVLDGRPELHRWLFTTAATTIATLSARCAIGWSEPAWGAVQFVLAGAILLLVRAFLVAIGLRLRNPEAPRQHVLGEPIDVLLGIVAASLGGLLAVAITHEPASALLAGPPLVLLDLAGQLPQWRRSAQNDAKTGLANVAHWERLARTELARAQSREQAVSLLLLDLDHFKRVNDEIGHLAGDTVLAAVAMMLRSSVRREDVVGRFGGEEFVVLLPATGADLACSVADRIRRSTAALSVPARDIEGEPREIDDLTVSIGVATTTRFGYQLPDLLIAADAALLAAKSAGRNAVTLA